MKILIVHLSDSHLKYVEDELFLKIQAMANSIKTSLTDISHIFVIFSGDVTYSGEKNQYTTATTFLSKLEDYIKYSYPKVAFEYIVAPGNHDCNFSPDTHGDTRELLIKNIISDRELLKKQGILSDCLKPELNYFEWSASIQKMKLLNFEDHFVQIHDYNLDGCKPIRFISYNTSWMSIPNKSQDDILFPINILSKSKNDYKADIVFSVFHHPYEWFKTDISKSFRQHVENNSNVIFTGHEHKAK